MLEKDELVEAAEEEGEEVEEAHHFVIHSRKGAAGFYELALE